MTEIQMEERSSKKKLLVPIVVLMLCAVSVIGAAYAYTTTVTDTNSKLDGEYYSIDLYGASGGSAYTGDLTLSEKIKFVSAKTDGNVTVTAETVTGTVCYVAVFLNQETASVDEAADIEMNVTSSVTGWNIVNATNTNGVDNATATNSGVKITFTLGEKDNAGYRAVTIQAEYTQSAATQGEAKEITKAVSDLVDNFVYGVTFTYTSN